MLSLRWSWPVVLAVTVLGLGAQELLSFQAIYLGESRREIVMTAALWATWVASPYLISIVLMIIARRTRSARRLSMIGALVVTAIGVMSSVAAWTDHSGDPLVGLLWMFAPLAQLGVVIGIGVIVVPAVLRDRRRITSDATQLVG